jgi:hypothetical protein
MVTNPLFKLGLLCVLALAACAQDEDEESRQSAPAPAAGADDAEKPGDGGDRPNNEAPKVDPSDPATGAPEADPSAPGDKEPAAEPFDPAKAVCNPLGSWSVAASDLQGFGDNCANLSSWIGDFTIVQNDDGTLALETGPRSLSVSPDGCQITVSEYSSRSVMGGYLMFNHQMTFRLEAGGSQGLDGRASYSVGGEGYGSCSGKLAASRGAQR